MTLPGKKVSDVLVEENVQGKDFRFLVVGTHLVAAACRIPAQVTGDGVHTVAELVARENTNPRRGDNHALNLSKIPLDTVSLAVLEPRALRPIPCRLKAPAC